jgi:hypothetical protein
MSEKPKLDGMRWSRSTRQFINDCYEIVTKNLQPAKERKYDESFTRCEHGVWKGDHCWTCGDQQTRS